jgi:tetratricopeptide (TPR) repeat protein
LATGKDGAAENDPTTFAAAMERADDERELMASKELVSQKLRERLATEKLSDQEKAEIRKQLDEAEKAIPVHRRNAIRFYALAIRLAPELTRAEIRASSAGDASRSRAKQKGKAAPSVASSDGQKQLDELNRARYYYAWLCLQDGRNHEAAVAGRFLAENYPTGLIGRGAAQVAMIAWSRLYNEAKGSKAFETAGLQGVLTLITERYPDPETSASAFILLSKIMARQGQFKEAVEILKKAPKESVQVPGAQVEIGQLIIKEYFASKRLPKEQQPSTENSKWMIDTSKSLITEGMKNLEATGRIDASLVSAAYAVAQLYADLSDAKQALAVIEHPKYGPLTLVTKKDPIVQPPNFKPEFVHNVYKLSLRVFLSLADKQPEMLTRAEQTLATLEKLVSPEQLSTFYKQMAGEFQTQLENAEPGERAALAKGFTRFLRKIRDGKDSEQYNTLAYVFSQFMGVADSLYKEGEKPTAEAREYYSDAAKTGDKILKLSSGGKIEIKPANLMAVRVEIAKALAKTGEFEKAIESLVSILEEKPNTLGVQIEAARIYELWGAEELKYYKHAIGGGAWNKEKGGFTIWGWNGIVQRVSRSPNLRETYYEAVLQAANCQYRLSQASAGEADKKKYADMAKRTILRVQQGHPELGGPKMKTRFDGLLRQVQKQLNESPVGLPAATNAAG